MHGWTPFSAVSNPSTGSAQSKHKHPKKRSRSSVLTALMFLPELSQAQSTQHQHHFILMSAVPPCPACIPPTLHPPGAGALPPHNHLYAAGAGLRSRPATNFSPGWCRCRSSKAHPRALPVPGNLKERQIAPYSRARGAARHPRGGGSASRTAASPRRTAPLRLRRRPPADGAGPAERLLM